MLALLLQRRSACDLQTSVRPSKCDSVGAVTTVIQPFQLICGKKQTLAEPTPPAQMFLQRHHALTGSARMPLLMPCASLHTMCQGFNGAGLRRSPGMLAIASRPDSNIHQTRPQAAASASPPASLLLICTQQSIQQHCMCILVTRTAFQYTHVVEPHIIHMATGALQSPSSQHSHESI